MGYMYAAGQNSIICYEDGVLCQRLEEVPVEIVQIQFEDDRILIWGVYSPLGYLEEMLLFAQSGSVKRIPQIEQRDNKISFHISLPFTGKKKQTIMVHLEYLHTRVRLDCRLQKNVKCSYFTKKVGVEKGNLVIHKRDTPKKTLRAIKRKLMSAR